MGGIWRIPDHLEREVGLHAGADVELAAMKQRPAAVALLDATKIRGDLALEPGLRLLAEVVRKKHVFGWDGRVRFELEAPMAVCLLQLDKRLHRLFHCCAHIDEQWRPRNITSADRSSIHRPPPAHAWSGIADASQ